MTTHTIKPSRETLHGHFSRDLSPVLTIDPGDTVHYQTLDARWIVEPQETPEAQPRRFEPRDAELDAGHALCGPIAIRGAQPGMTLAVHIDELRPGSWGWTVAGGWSSAVNDRLNLTEEGIYLLWKLDTASMTWSNQFGHRVKVDPFMGVLGMPPAEPGIHSTTPPRITGGNIDCKELVAGSTVYLPIAVEGGLFSVGDGHGLQADGESSGTAIECPMDHVSLTFQLHADLSLATPRAHTPSGWLTFGFHENLNEASFIALDAMLDLMQELHDLKRVEALALSSLVVDLRVTQIANQVFGVHAVLPHDELHR